MTRKTPSRVLVFFQHKPFPITSGAQQRCMAVLRALKELGCEVTLYGSNLFTDTVWDDASVRDIETRFGIQVVIYRGNAAEKHRARVKLEGMRREDWGSFATPGLKRAFAQYARQWRPDTVFVSYTFFGDLVDQPEFRGVNKIMDSLDMFSVYEQMQRFLSAHLPPAPLQPAAVPPFLLDENLLNDQHFVPWPEEYAACRFYDTTLAVSSAEAAAMAGHTHHTRVVHLPITSEPREPGNTYAAAPVFVAAVNPLQVQGYAWFAQKALPIARQLAPMFELSVAGPICRAVADVPGITRLGYVPDIDALYRKSAFAICPQLGATGQQIKVVEAMSAGLPVVIMQQVAASSPVEHGVNGFIASDAARFAHYCALLFDDRVLCARLGAAARETVARNWSHARLVKDLGNLLAGRNVRPAAARGSSPVRSTRPPKPLLSVMVDLSVGEARLTDTLRSLHAQGPGLIEVLLLHTGPRKADMKLPGLITRSVASLPHALRAGRARYACILRAGEILYPGAAATLERMLAAGHEPAWFAGRLSRASTALTPEWIMPADASSTPALGIRIDPANTLFQRRLAHGAKTVHQVYRQLAAGGAPQIVEALIGAPLVDDAPRPLEFPCHGTSAWPLLEPVASGELRAQEQRLATSAALTAAGLTRAKDDHLTPAFIKAYLLARWRELAESGGRRTRICLFGAGVHTRWLLGMVRGAPGPEVIAVLDDVADTRQRILGIPVRRPGRIDPRTIDVFVPSSDTSAARFEERIRERFGCDVKIERLYDGLPPGPYPKKL